MELRIIIDVWGQILTTRMTQTPWLGSLLRWMKAERTGLELSESATLRAMDQAGVDLMILSAWSAPEG